MFPDLEVLLAVTRTLEELGVPYVVGGSVASSALGIFRTTQDADVAADLRPEQVAPFCERLAPAFYLSEERIRGAVAKRRWRAMPPPSGPAAAPPCRAGAAG